MHLTPSKRNCSHSKWKAIYTLKLKMLKKYNELNRALIKRKELLPNVFEFSTKKFGIHEYAACYGIEKNP